MWEHFSKNIELLNNGDVLNIDTRDFMSIISVKGEPLNFKKEDGFTKEEIINILNKWNTTPRIGWLKLIGHNDLFLDMKYMGVNLKDDLYFITSRKREDQLKKKDLNKYHIYQAIKDNKIINTLKDFGKIEKKKH